MPAPAILAAERPEPAAAEPVQDYSVALGVVLEKRKAQSIWIDHLWVPYGVLVNPPPLAPMTPMGRADAADPQAGERFYLGEARLVLHAGDTAQYRDNLATGAPKVWVVLRCTEADEMQLLAVTADPSEGEMHTEAGANLVEPVPMPPELVPQIAEFVARFHVEREFFKRKRDGARADTKPDGQAS